MPMGDNILVQTAVPVLLGAFLASNKNKMVAAAGVGMMGAGLASAGRKYVPGLADYLEEDLSDIINDVLNDAASAAEAAIQELGELGEAGEQLNDDGGEYVAEGEFNFAINDGGNADGM